MANNMLFSFVIILVFAANGIVHATGRFEFKLIRFQNKAGKVASGTCCEGLTSGAIFGCVAGAANCDHRLFICIDDISSDPDDVTNCKYASYETPTVESNDVVFSNIKDNTFRNPYYVDFPIWPGKVRVKVEVWDNDAINHDFVDRFVYDFTNDIGKIKYLKQIGRGNIETSFEAQLSVSCLPGYYGNDCSKYCVAQNSEFGHYTCDQKTGNKKCLPGYSGISCNVRNPCVSAPCKNGASCIVSISTAAVAGAGYTCMCSTGFSGQNCENFVGISSQATSSPRITTTKATITSTVQPTSPSSRTTRKRETTTPKPRTPTSNATLSTRKPTSITKSSPLRTSPSTPTTGQKSTTIVNTNPPSTIRTSTRKPTTKLPTTKASSSNTTEMP